MNLYELLEKNQRQTQFSASPEQIYYNENSYRLNGIESYSYLSNPSDSFGVVKGNIILRALENKESIEKLLKNYEKIKDKSNLSLDEYMKSGLLTLPYLLYKESKIYVPIFPLSVANVYSERFERMKEMPYKRIFRQYEAALIDPFDYYGYNIFISYFTRLVLIRKEPKCAAFYDYDSNAIYMINDEGRLDNKICLFDKELKHPVTTHLISRISEVVDAYLSNDREMMIEKLREGELISESMLAKIRKTDQKKEMYYKKKGYEI